MGSMVLAERSQPVSIAGSCFPAETHFSDSLFSFLLYLLCNLGFSHLLLCFGILYLKSLYSSQIYVSSLGPQFPLRIRDIYSMVPLKVLPFPPMGSMDLCLYLAVLQIFILIVFEILCSFVICLQSHSYK